MRYFLYEYETSLLSESRQKIEWNDLLRTEKDKISIEHIYPQTETDEWATFFGAIEKEHRRFYNATLGNLLLLSMSINASLQNDSFDDKKYAKYDSTGKKIRNGYSDGSHSEIEVSHNVPGDLTKSSEGDKTPHVHGESMELRFKNDEERGKLLFLKLWGHE